MGPTASRVARGSDDVASHLHGASFTVREPATTAAFVAMSRRPSVTLSFMSGRVYAILIRGVIATNPGIQGDVIVTKFGVFTRPKRF